MDDTNSISGEEDDVSSETILILGCLGAFFVAVGLFLFARLVQKVPRRHRPPHSTKTSRPASQVINSEELHKKQKTGVSLKKLVKNSQHGASRQAASEKPVDHGLYLTSLKGFHANVLGLDISPEGWIATVTEDQALKVFDARDISGKAIPSYRHALSRVPVDVAYAGPQSLFVLAEGPLGDAVLQLVRIENGRFAEDWTAAGVHGKDGGKGLLAGVNQFGQGIAVSYSGQTDLQVYTDRGVHLARVDSSGLQTHSAALSPRDCRFFAAATFTSDVKIYEAQFTRDGEFRQVQKVMDLKKAHRGQVYCLSFSSDGSKAVTASKDGTWAVWNIDVRYALDEDPKILLQRRQETGAATYTHLAFGPDGIVAAASGSTLHFLDIVKGTLLEIVEEAHDAPIVAMSWSPVQHAMGAAKVSLLVTSALDKRVRLWRAPSTYR